MPELPEVETIRRGLNEHLPGLSIEEIEVFFPGILKNESPDNFRLRLLRDCFVQVDRKGKYLLLYLASDQVIVIHLRMTGNLYYTTPNYPKEKHLHLLFILDSKEELRFVDQRKFGEVYLILASQVQDFPPLKKLGLEPFNSSLSLYKFEEMLKNSKRPIKQFLLDQTKIAGIGNIYADEALFLAKVMPTRKADSLSREEIRRLFRAIREVLKKSIKAQGRTFSNYRNARGEAGDYQPLVHDRERKFCPFCGTPIEYTRVSQRGTFFCPKCQK
ncbi:MAG: bifunctional DNA-formamidopyrimidine glycosylase/DNA-(apurinic or apyrimidinic site) lyase [Coprothermobacterota bacterium]|jgi:formamidopyrimidine-DNA glycosylase|nr:bifunctional DNA-formamidopyrimidine glycosylase/DNA-(apurinic or apyrimidinic site) lyase [Caldisericota bacterium]MDI6869120.1 bifunctional DNA-formamidopyrimidine glycosylase/DNA-(apurinic or apyrimidinic site) lyase [Coprothermobacterota bacterium]